jgi:hypothetical protein
MRELELRRESDARASVTKVGMRSGVVFRLI